MGSVIVPQLVTPPASPITLEEAKAHLRVDTVNSPGPDDDLISAMIDAAVAYVDGPSGILRFSALATEWEIALDEFPEGEIVLPLPYPVSVTSVKYTDGDGAEQTVPDTDYVLDAYSSEGRIVLADGASWPDTGDTTSAVRVRWIAGLSECPADVRAAMLLMIGYLYDNRGSVPVEMPEAIGHLLNTRKRVVMA